MWVVRVRASRRRMHGNHGTHSSFMETNVEASPGTLCTWDSMAKLRGKQRPIN